MAKDKKKVNASEYKKKKHFWKDYRAELKKVNWLTPKQLLNNTTAVIVMVIVVSAIVFVLDFTFETLNNQGVERLKSIVQQDESNTVDNTVENNLTNNTITDNTVDNSVSNEISNETENNVTNSNEVQE